MNSKKEEELKDILQFFGSVMLIEKLKIENIIIVERAKRKSSWNLGFRVVAKLRELSDAYDFPSLKC